jgi:hypothetical protein
MRAPILLGWSLVAVAVLVAGGCGGTNATHRQAEQTYANLAAPGAPDAQPSPAAVPSSSAGSAKPLLLFAPREDLSLASAATVEPAAAAAQPAVAEKAPATADQFPSIQNMSFGQVLKQDLREMPGKLWSGTKYSFGNVQNLTVLSLAFGADRIVRYNLDDRVRHNLDHNDTSMHETGDFGSVIGNPGLHLGVGAVWYAVSVYNQDSRNHSLAKVLIEALLINDMSTMLLKVTVHDHSPNGEHFGWPSGHMSSSMTIAAVMHEYYGWKAGLPLYLLAGYEGATRLEDREHNLSDLLFGGALGWVIGHSVVRGELPQVAGFTVLPYGGSGTGGLMFLRQW